MRFLRAFAIGVITAVVGCLLAFFVGDYLTRLAHVPEMEGQRGMTVVFLCAPLGILVGLIIGIVSAILVRRQGLAGFLIAQGWSLLILCAVAGMAFPFSLCCDRSSPENSPSSSTRTPPVSAPVMPRQMSVPTMAKP